MELDPAALAAEMAQVDAALTEMRRRLVLDLIITGSILVIALTFPLMRGKA